jgi:fucose permease
VPPPSHRRGAYDSRLTLPVIVLSTLRPARVAIAVMFFVNGTLFGTWVSRIPAIKAAHDLSQSRLGLALLAIGLGTVVGLPLTSWLTGRFGSHRVLAASALGGCLALPLAGAAGPYLALVAALVWFGANLGAMDVAVNAQAALLERQAGRSLMSGFHGLWSAGGIAGSGLGSFLTARNLGPTAHFLLVAVLLAALAVVVARHLVPDGHDPASGAPAPSLAWPSRQALAIGTIAACGAVVEGGIADWSGVYLLQTLRAPASLAALAFGAFSTTMMTARFAGDRLIDRLGRRTMLRIGPALTAAALAVVLSTSQPAIAIVALGCAGLGMSTVFPIAFGEAGALPGPAGHSIAAVATMAYGAQLLGPPLIGFIADATSLPRALLVMIAACVAIVLLSGRLALRSHPPR